MRDAEGKAYSVRPDSRLISSYILIIPLICESARLFCECTIGAVRPCSREDSNLHVLPAGFSKPCTSVNKQIRISLTPVNVMPICMPDVVYSQAARQTVLLLRLFDLGCGACTMAPAL